jgi:hypothetical protein
VVQIDGEHDVFGDGSVICLPTYGHTPGHQSLKCRHAGGEVVLVQASVRGKRGWNVSRSEVNLPESDGLHAVMSCCTS